MRTTGFLNLAGIAAFLTALTTLGVHFIEFQAETFEARLLLARDPMYLFQKWLIVFHCLMVIVSMFGVATIARIANPGLAALGALFFAVFGVAEITRMFGVLAYLNPLREKYLATADTAIRQVIQLQIDAFVLAGTVLFLVFILAFALGNLCFGLAITRNKAEDRWVARGFLFWATLTLLAFGNSFWENSTLEPVIEANNKFYQPAFRAVVGWWLLRKSFSWNDR